MQIDWRFSSCCLRGFTVLQAKSAFQLHLCNPTDSLWRCTRVTEDIIWPAVMWNHRMLLFQFFFLGSLSGAKLTVTDLLGISSQPSLPSLPSIFSNTLPSSALSFHSAVGCHVQREPKPTEMCFTDLLGFESCPSCVTRENSQPEHFMYFF